MSNQSGGPPRKGTGKLPAMPDPANQALIPIGPESAIAEIIKQVETAGAPNVELLVPDNTKALQSVAGCDALGQAAKQAGIHITLFTADEKTITAATLAKLELVPVGGAVLPPQASAAPRTIASQQRPAPTQAQAAQRSPSTPANAQAAAPNRQPPRASAPQAPNPSTARPTSTARDATAAGPAPATPPARDPNPNRPAAASTPPPRERNQAARPSGGRSTRDADEEFLARLQEFEQDAAISGPTGTTFQSNEGSLIYETPGDVGVRRPSNDDEDWDAALGAMGATMAAEPAPSRRPARPAEGREAHQPRPSGRLLNRGERPPVALPEVPQRRRGEQDAVEVDQPPRRNQLLLLIAAIAILALVALAWFMWPQVAGLVSRPPTLALKPPATQTNAQTFDNLVVPISTQPVTNTLAIYGRLLDRPVSVVVPGVAEASTVSPIGKATGTIVLRNTTSQPIEIGAGTPVVANGIRFIFDRTVSVPPASSSADGIAFGRGEASLTAEVPGSQGNLGAGAITSIPGYEGALRVEQLGFAGGTDQEVRIVRIEDVNAILPAAMSQLYTTGVQALQIAIAQEPGWALPAATITPTLDVLKQLQGVEYSVLPPIGSVSEDGSFQLELRARFQALAEPEAANAKLIDQLNGAVKSQLFSFQGVDPESQVTITQWNVRDQSIVASASVRPPGSQPQFAAEFVAQVEAQLRGKPRAEAEQFLQRLFAEGQIASLPELPADWAVVPANLSITTAP